MKRMMVILAVCVLTVLLTGSMAPAPAAAKPVSCYVALPVADRDAAVASIETLLAVALRIDGTMLELAEIQEAHRIIAALEAAPAVGCGMTSKR